jgi:hypothetical protein
LRPLPLLLLRQREKQHAMTMSMRHAKLVAT